MIRTIGLVSLTYSLLVLGFAFWIVSEAKGSFGAEEYISFGLLILHAVLQMVYVGLTMPLLKFPSVNEISTLDDFIAQNIEIDSNVLKPSGFAVACGIVGFLGLAVISFGSGTILYTMVRRGVDEFVPMILSIGILLTAVPSVIYNVRTIGMRRFARDLPEEDEIEESYSFNQFEED